MMKWFNSQLMPKPTPYWNIPFFLVTYGISGFCEEIGWTAIVTDKLLALFNVVITGVIVGIIWAIWHVIPFMQTYNCIKWILW